MSPLEAREQGKNDIFIQHIHTANTMQNDADDDKLEKGKMEQENILIF